MNSFLFRRLCLSVAKSYDEDFMCDIAIKAYHLSALKRHFNTTWIRFEGLSGEELNSEVVKFLNEVQDSVNERTGYIE